LVFVVVVVLLPILLLLFLCAVVAMAKLRGGASLVERPPSFSSDGKLLLVSTSSFHVSVYSVATGLLVISSLPFA
jgi:hypothetical protein